MGQSQEKQINPYFLAFRPAGWDNEKKIAILHENFTTVKPEDAYEDFIVKPPVRKVPMSVTLRCSVCVLLEVSLFVCFVRQETYKENMNHFQGKKKVIQGPLKKKKSALVWC